PEDQAVAHALVARHLESADGDAAMIAGHWELGGAPARATPHYLTAVLKAGRRNDLPAVLALAAKGPGRGARGGEGGVLRSVEASAQAASYQFVAAWNASREALELLPRGHPQRLQSLAFGSFAGAQLGRMIEIAAPIAELLEAEPGEAECSSYVQALG